MKSRIEQIVSLSAIYYALLQSGYDFYSVERNEGHIRKIQGFIGEETVPAFFSGVRQDACEVYPYWPRAFILERAAFFLNDGRNEFTDYDAFRNQVLSASNISPEEKGSSLWDWIPEFPAALKSVLNSQHFRRYAEWEREWIAEQNNRYHKELYLLDSVLSDCRNKYNASCMRIGVALSPIKCVYSSDYHISGNYFVFTSGDMRIGSVVHEYLHTVIHPLLAGEIFMTGNKRYPETDASYYLDGSEQGYRNAFEEYAVRVLTGKVMNGEWPDDLYAFLQQLAKV